MPQPHDGTFVELCHSHHLGSKLGCTPVAWSGKEGAHPAGAGRNRVTQLPFLSSLSTELPSACTPHLSLAGLPLLLMLSRLANLSHTEHTIAL